MTHIFRVEETLAALKEAVAERGEDYVYQGDPLSLNEACSYSTVAGAPSCIVGEVLARLTPDIFKSIHEYEWYGEEDGKFDLHEQCFGAMVKGSAGNIDMPFGADAINLLFRAQTAQDYGASWGDAVFQAQVPPRGYEYITLDE